MIWSWIILIVTVYVLFRLTGFVFSILGHMIGMTFSIACWLIAAFAAVMVFGMTLVILPVVLVIGALAIAKAIL